MFDQFTALPADYLFRFYFLDHSISSLLCPPPSSLLFPPHHRSWLSSTTSSTLATSLLLSNPHRSHRKSSTSAFCSSLIASLETHQLLVYTMKPEGLEIQEPALFNRPLGSPQPSSAGLASIPTTANTSVELIGETLAPNEDKKPQEAIKIGASGNENDALVMTDRGWRAWLAVVAGVINFWAGFGTFTTIPSHVPAKMERCLMLIPRKGMLNCWGTFQAKYAQEPWGQEVTLADLSWIGSVQVGSFHRSFNESCLEEGEHVADEETARVALLSRWCHWLCLRQNQRDRPHHHRDLPILFGVPARG